MGDKPVDSGSPSLNDLERIRIIGLRIRTKRIAEGLTLGQAAEQSGVSAPTLSRLERQGGSTPKSLKSTIVPDTRTVTAVLAWLGNGYEDGESQDLRGVNPLKEVDPNQWGNTPEMVEAYLRADRRLNPETAEFLARQFRMSYEHFAATDDADGDDKTFEE